MCSIFISVFFIIERISYISNKPYKVKVYVRWGIELEIANYESTCLHTEPCITSRV